METHTGGKIRAGMRSTCKGCARRGNSPGKRPIQPGGIATTTLSHLRASTAPPS